MKTRELDGRQERDNGERGGPVEIELGPTLPVTRSERTGHWAAASVRGGTFFPLASAAGPLSLTGVRQWEKVPGKQMTKKSYATISRNQPPVKFKA